MSSPDDAVASVIADVDGGQTTEVLAAYIKRHFVKPRSWFGRLLAGSQEHDHEVRRVVAFDDAGFFRRARLVEVFIRGHMLEGHVLPAGGSFGLFALSDGEPRYLSGRLSEVEAVLRAENRRLNEYPAWPLARLLSESLLRQGNDAAEVLVSDDALTTYDGGLNGFGGRYEIDLAEWRRVHDDFVGPTLTIERGGWDVEFCTLRGWMHMKQTVTRHRFRIDDGYGIHDEDRVLTRRLFKTVPGLLY
jgi:hypothetical protein